MHLYHFKSARLHLRKVYIIAPMYRLVVTQDTNPLPQAAHENHRTRPGVIRRSDSVTGCCQAAQWRCCSHSTSSELGSALTLNEEQRTTFYLLCWWKILGTSCLARVIVEDWQTVAGTWLWDTCFDAGSWITRTRLGLVHSKRFWPIIKHAITPTVRSQMSSIAR